MSDTQHTPSDDRSFRASLIRHGAAAGALVVLVTGAFWAIGSLGDDDAGTVASPSPDAPDPGPDRPETDEAPDPDPGDVGDVDVADPPAVDPDPVDDEPAEVEADEGQPDGEPDDADPTDSEPDDADQGDDTDEADDADEPDEAPQAPAIDPATITVQVLDGYQADGGAAADGVAAQLGDAGYDIVARNPALRYEQTTVLWTAGFEAEGRQVAAAIGAADVRQQPGNLSSQVAVHVVVGSDRG